MPKKIWAPPAPPTRDARPGERFQLGVRVTPKVKKLIDDAADENGHSLNQETELRIERSFDRQRLLSEVLALAFGEELAGLLLMLGIAMHDQGRRMTYGKSDWTSNAVAYDAAVFAAMRLLEYGRPAGSKALDSDYDIAAQWVEELIQAIIDGDKDVVGRGPRGDAILELAGPMAIRMGEGLARMRGEVKRHDSHTRSSSRKKREAS